jgi:hypothetical protein
MSSATTKKELPKRITSHRGVFLFLTALAIVGFFLYVFNLGNPLFWDDADWIVNNPSVHALTWDNIKFIFQHDVLAGIGLQSNYYRPFLFLTFLANYLVSGIHPWSYHVVSNLIHIGNGILLFLLLDRFLRSRAIAMIAALLFVVHPLQTEAVTYISGRGDPLSVLLMLSALLLFLRGQGLWDGRRRGLVQQVIPYVLVVCAIGSRETAFLFPAYLIICLMTFCYREGFWRDVVLSLRQSWLFIALSGAYLVMRLTFLNFQNTLNFYHTANTYTEHFSYRVYTFLHVVLTYLKIIIVPTGLHMERDTIVHTSLFQFPVWISLIVLPLILWIIVRDFSKTRLWFFAWGIFFVSLAPTSGIIPINALIYEHWLYFALAGIATLASWHAVRLWEAAGPQRILKGVLVMLGIGYVVFLSVQTVRRNLLWGDTKAFYLDILFYEPTNVRVLNNLANYESDHGSIAEAEELYWRAVKADDVQPAPYYNLGNILRDRQDYAGALELYKKALAADPTFPYAYSNIAWVYGQQGNLSGALEAMQALHKLQPLNVGALYNIGIILKAMGRREEAKTNLLEALRLAAGDPGMTTQCQEALQGL